jgi:hypothetical protein
VELVADPRAPRLQLFDSCRRVSKPLAFPSTQPLAAPWHCFIDPRYAIISPSAHHFVLAILATRRAIVSSRSLPFRSFGCLALRNTGLSSHPSSLIHINIEFLLAVPIFELQANLEFSQLIPPSTPQVSAAGSLFLRFCPYSPVTSLASWSNRLLLRGARWTRREPVVCCWTDRQPWGVVFAVVALVASSPESNPPSTLQPHPSPASRDMIPATQPRRPCIPCVDVAVCIPIVKTVSAGAQSTGTASNNIPRCLPVTVHAAACSAARSQRCRKHTPTNCSFPCPVPSCNRRAAVCEY